MKAGDKIRLDTNTVADIVQVVSSEGSSFSGVASIGTVSAIFWGTFRFSQKQNMWIRK